MAHVAIQGPIVSAGFDRRVGTEGQDTALEGRWFSVVVVVAMLPIHSSTLMKP